MRRGPPVIKTASQIMSAVAAPPLPMPKTGDVVWIGRAANYHFVGHNSIAVRVIRIVPEPLVPGIAWIHGYQLSRGGNAVGRCTIPVRTAGLIFTWNGRRDSGRAT